MASSALLSNHKNGVIFWVIFAMSAPSTLRNIRLSLPCSLVSRMRAGQIDTNSEFTAKKDPHGADVRGPIWALRVRTRSDSDGITRTGIRLLDPIAIAPGSHTHAP